MSDTTPRFIVSHSRLNRQDHSQLMMNKGGIEITMSFFNGTGRPIYIIDRSGLRFKIPASEQYRTNEVIIRKHYAIPRSALADMQRIITTTDLLHDDYPELALFSEAMGAITNRSINQKIIIDTVVPIADITNDGVYISNADLVVTMEGTERKVRHPFSKPKMTEERYESLRSEYKGFGTFIEIIDNNNTIGDRFILIAKETRQISPRKDITRESGIYLVTIDENSTTSLHYKFEQAEEIGLYRTKEDALSAGNAGALLDHSIAQLTHEVKMKTLDHQREMGELNRAHDVELNNFKRRNLEIENDNKTKDAEIQRIQRERENDKLNFDLRQATMKAEYETQRLKDQQTVDQRTNKSKFWVETLKIVGVIFTVGLAIFGALKKSSK